MAFDRNDDQASSRETKPARRRLGCMAALAVVSLILAFVAWEYWPLAQILLGIPRQVVVSQAIGLDMWRNHPQAIGFSPDGNHLAYIWRDATYVYPPELGARPLTMTDGLQVRWVRLDQPDKENILALDSVDLRPDGLVYYNLDGRVCFSPDSRHLAAVCATDVYLIDMASGSSTRIEYSDEYFRDLRWISSDEFAFVTTSKAAEYLWRLKVADDPNSRQRINLNREINSSGSGWPHDDLRESLPLPLLRYHWSPTGRHVVLPLYNSGYDSYYILDVMTGHVSDLPFQADDICWKPNGSAFLAVERIYKKPPRVFLVECANGAAVELTDDFRTAFGKELEFRLDSDLWTADGLYVTLCTTHETPSGLKDPGYLIQPHPFKVVLKRDRFLRRSPIAGWVLVQGNNDMIWLDYAGKRTAPIQGWPNSWMWSPDPKFAVEIRKGRPMILRPSLPPRP